MTRITSIPDTLVIPDGMTLIGHYIVAVHHPSNNPAILSPRENTIPDQYWCGFEYPGSSGEWLDITSTLKVYGDISKQELIDDYNEIIKELLGERGRNTMFLDIPPAGDLHIMIQPLLASHQPIVSERIKCG